MDEQLTRALLIDIGFKCGTGWDHEVWVYEGMFWIHFGGQVGTIKGREFDGNQISRREFFKVFVAALEDEWCESQPKDFQD